MDWSLTGLPLPIVLRPPSPLTDDELISFSRKNEPYRIEKNKDGDITVMTPVGTEGGKRELRVGMQLMAWADEDGTGEANGPNAGWNLPDGSTFSPDACWTRLDRVEQFSNFERERYLPLCPDFVIEVRSQSDSLKVLQAKMETWIANGARLAWMLDPYAATLTVYRPDRAPEVLLRPEVVEAEEPVAGFRLTTSQLRAQ